MLEIINEAGYLVASARVGGRRLSPSHSLPQGRRFRRLRLCRKGHNPNENLKANVYYILYCSICSDNLLLRERLGEGVRARGKQVCLSLSPECVPGINRRGVNMMTVYVRKLCLNDFLFSGVFRRRLAPGSRETFKRSRVSHYVAPKV